MTVDFLNTGSSTYLVYSGFERKSEARFRQSTWAMGLRTRNMKPWNQWNPKGTSCVFLHSEIKDFWNPRVIFGCHVRQNMTYALAAHGKFTYEPSKSCHIRKKTRSISFENFNFLLLNAFVQKQTMTAPCFFFSAAKSGAFGARRLLPAAEQ